MEADPVILAIIAFAAIVIVFPFVQQWRSNKRRRHTYVLMALHARGKKGSTANDLVHLSSGVLPDANALSDLGILTAQGLVMTVLKVQPNKRRPITLYFLTNSGEAAASKLS